MIKNISISLFTFILTILLAELVLNQFYIFKTYGYPQFYFKNNINIGYDLAENFPKTRHIIDESYSYDIWTNKLGCFDNQYNGKFDNILLVGDSFTWGYTEFSKKFGTLLEKKLNTRILKCGVSGYGTLESLEKTKKFISKISKKTKLIIVGYFVGNDIINSYLYPNATVVDGYTVTLTEFGKKPGEIKKRNKNELNNIYNKSILGLKKSSIKLFLSKYSVIYNLYRQSMNIKINTNNKIDNARFELVYLLKDSRWIETAWNQHLLEINKFKEYADSINSKLLFLIFPSLDQIENKNLTYKPNKLVVNYLDKKNIEHIDFSNIINSVDNYHRLDKHFNEKGNYKVYEEVYKYLKKDYLNEK